MSRRKRPASTPAPGGDEPRGRGGRGRTAARGDADSGGSAARRRAWRGIAADVAILIAVFAVTAAIAELAGAANLGVALGIGQVAFAIALVVVLLRA
jgi:hypothetical protein